jgi:VIT1/CCC1 family predicted Fe2+/Mn2+ transporter
MIGLKLKKKFMKNSHQGPYFDNWQHEMDAVVIYETLAEIEKGNQRGELFSKLSKESQIQAKIWIDKAGPKNNWHYQQVLKVKIIHFLLKKIGPRYLMDVLSAMKIRGMSVYRLGDTHLNESSVQDENIHSKIKSGSNLRAAIFGINDGLVSNASLVFAMVGAGTQEHTIILTGVAGLLAGGFSMASGEYVSVKSQTELYENQISLEREELQEFPEEEAKELSLIYQAKGIDRTMADQIANKLIQDKEKALDTLAREELGLNPSELGAPLQAALSSFICFSIGAALPILPFLFFAKDIASISSFITSLFMLFLIGVLISFLTGKSPLKNGLRMCLLGLMAGVTTYLIGKLIGVSLT